MTKIIIFYGLKRSGNHGILNLFTKGYPNYVHINNTYLSFNEYEKNKNLDITLRNVDCRYTGFKNSDLLIISMENKIPDLNAINEFKQMEEDLNVYILIRNPINNLESAYNIYDDKSNVREIQELWIKYSNIFIHNPNDYDVQLNYLIYEKFYNDEQYRIDIFNKLKINYNDIKIFLNDSPGYAESSFKSDDTKKYSKHNSIELKIKLYSNDVEFKKLITNEIEENWKIIINKFNLDKLEI